MTLSIVTFKWKPNPGYRAKYGARNVNILYSMFRRHLKIPFDFFCVTDDDRGIEAGVKVIPLWDDLANVPNPHGLSEPSCYRRLKLFDPKTYKGIGDRILWIDLDMVLTGDVTPLFDRPESMVLLKTTAPNIPINGSLVLFTPDDHQDIWTDFDPAISPRLTRPAGCFGSDQGWLGYRRKDSAAFWNAGPGGDGIYFFGEHLRLARCRNTLPDDARLVSFHGRGSPWDPEMYTYRWIARNYKEMV